MTQWVNKKDMNASEAIQEYEKDKSRSRKGDVLHQSPMSHSPISISSSPEHVNLVDLHMLDTVAEARRVFPTPEPGHLSPNSTFSVDLDLSPATRINTVGVEAEVSHMEGGAGTENTRRAGEISSEVVSRCICGSDLPDAGPCTCRGYHCQGTSEATCSFRDSIRTCDTHGIRCTFCTCLIEDCQCNARSTYGPEVLRALEGVMKAACRSHPPVQDPPTVLSAQQWRCIIQLADSDSTVNGEEGEAPPLPWARGRQGGR